MVIYIPRLARRFCVPAYYHSRRYHHNEWLETTWILGGRTVKTSGNLVLNLAPDHLCRNTGVPHMEPVTSYAVSRDCYCLFRNLLTVFTTGDRSSSATREPMGGRLSSTFLHEILFVFCLTVGLVGLSKRWNFLGRPGSYTLHSGLLSFYWRLDPRLDSVLLPKPKWWHNSVAEVQT